jgi:hypothetical protein
MSIPIMPKEQRNPPNLSQRTPTAPKCHPTTCSGQLQLGHLPLPLPLPLPFPLLLPLRPVFPRHAPNDCHPEAQRGTCFLRRKGTNQSRRKIAPTRRLSSGHAFSRAKKNAFRHFPFARPLRKPSSRPTTQTFRERDPRNQSRTQKPLPKKGALRPSPPAPPIPATPPSSPLSPAAPHPQTQSIPH